MARRADGAVAVLVQVTPPTLMVHRFPAHNSRQERGWIAAAAAAHGGTLLAIGDGEGNMAQGRGTAAMQRKVSPEFNVTVDLSISVYSRVSSCSDS